MKALLPRPKVPVLVTTPPRLTLVDFLQTMLVALSGIPGQLVRPEWQVENPKNPPLETDWLAFGIESNDPDAHSYQNLEEVQVDENTVAEVFTLARQETLTIRLSMYGPNSGDNISL